MKSTLRRRLVPALTVAGLALICVATRGGDPAGQRPAHIGGMDDAGGVVKGVVTYIGATPQRKPVLGLNANRDYVAAREGKPLLSETFVFGRNGDSNSLVNVYVYVSKGLDRGSFEPPKQAVIVDQVGCQYVPHVAGVMAGQPVQFRNSDAFLHNVWTIGIRINPGFNKAMPQKGMVLNERFAKPEMGIVLGCSTHTWMRSYLHVMEHPYYAVTGEDGTFELRGLPDGEYEITAWHEFKRFFADQDVYQVTVKDGKADADLNIVYDVAPLPAAKPAPKPADEQG